MLGAAVLFSTGGAVIKACQLDAFEVASLRCGVAGLVLVALLPAARRRWSWRTLLVGLAYAVTLVSYVAANKATTAASAIFLQSASPLYLLILAPLLLGETIRRLDVAAMVLMAGGLVLCFAGAQTSSATAPDPATGNLWGLLAGIAWAFTVLGLRWLASGGGGGGEAVRAVVAGNALGCLGLLPWALPLSASARPIDALWILYLGAVQIALAYYLLTRGVARVPAFEASLLLLAEPVLTPLWTFAVHGEVPSGGTLAGGALILLASVGRTWLDWRQARRRRRAPGRVGPA